MTSLSKLSTLILCTAVVLPCIGCGAKAEPEKQSTAPPQTTMIKGGKAAVSAAIGDNGTDAVAGPGDKVGTPK